VLKSLYFKIKSSVVDKRRRDNRHEPELLIQTNVNFVNQDQTSSKPWFCALLFNTITICAVGLLALALARSKSY